MMSRRIPVHKLGSRRFLSITEQNRTHLQACLSPAPLLSGGSSLMSRLWGLFCACRVSITQAHTAASLSHISTNSQTPLRQLGLTQLTPRTQPSCPVQLVDHWRSP